MSYSEFVIVPSETGFDVYGVGHLPPGTSVVNPQILRIDWSNHHPKSSKIAYSYEEFEKWLENLHANGCTTEFEPPMKRYPKKG